MSKQMKLKCYLFSIDLNQLITAVVFFHWLKLRFFAIVLSMRSRIFLLTLPISDFVGLISLQVNLFAKFGLWSLSVMNASFSALVSTLSAILSFFAMSVFFMDCLRRFEFCFLVRFRVFFFLADPCM